MVNTVGRRVRAAREKFGWNQTELASRMGVRPNYVNRLEAGTMGNPSAERLAAVASALGLSIADLTSAAPGVVTGRRSARRESRRTT